MNEECLICKAPLTYLEADMMMECEICHKKENSKTRCVNGHYVCNECHTQGLDRIIELCMTSASRDPISIIEQMMALPTCHMHGPEHHVMVGAALLTAYHNAGGDIDLRSALTEMMNRGRSVPGGACGFWGACGAGISTGMFVSIISQSTPLTNEHDAGYEYESENRNEKIASAAVFQGYGACRGLFDADRRAAFGDGDHGGEG